MADRYVLDAYALLALLTDEDGSDQVARILESSESSVSMSAVNVGEVYYMLRRRRGLAAAKQMESAVFQQPNLSIVVPSWEQIRAVADIKFAGGLSFADAFAAALASELSAVLVTGDAEFARLERQGIIRISWVGSNKPPPHRLPF